MPSSVHDARSVVFTHDRPPAVDAMLNVHAIAIDRAHRSILAESRAPASLQGNVPASCRLMPTGVGSGSVPACLSRPVSARLPRFVPACLSGSVSACLSGSVSSRLSGSISACRTTLIGVRSARPAIVRIGARSTIARAAGATILRARAAGPGAPARVLRWGRMLRWGCVLRRSGMLCRSGVGCRCTRLLLRRSECGYDEKNQQYGQFREGVLSSVARIHRHSCEMRSSLPQQIHRRKLERPDKSSSLQSRS